MNSEKVKKIKRALEYCYNGCDGECYRNNNGEDYYDCRDGLLLVAQELINELENGKAFDKELQDKQCVWEREEMYETTRFRCSQCKMYSKTMLLMKI